MKAKRIPCKRFRPKKTPRARKPPAKPTEPSILRTGRYYPGFHDY